MSTFIFGYVIGMSLTLLLLYMGHCWYEFKHKQSETTVINKQKILNFMSQRMDGLRLYIDKDFGGHITGHHEAFREVKYWKEAIERGVFDEDGEIDG